MTDDTWDYLILTASNDEQAAAYAEQLALRRRLGLLHAVRQAIVVADPGGRRVGSGGSTVCCLIEVLRRELDEHSLDAGPAAWQDALARLRILVVHAGGDSRRLPAYGACGKAFVPIPDEGDSAIGVTLLDRQLPTYLSLPPTQQGAGQVVIASGDVLLGFDPGQIDFSAEGVTGLGCLAAPEQAAGHGVYCTASGGRVRRFLQKPSPAVQAREGAVDAYGQSVLDIGVFSLDAASAARLMLLCEVGPAADAKLPSADREPNRMGWRGPIAEAIESHGLDFYREICCALGAETTHESYLAAVRSAGSAWSDRLLERVHRQVSALPCRVQVLRHCEFLHFGTNRQLIDSGQRLLRGSKGFLPSSASVSVQNRIEGQGKIAGPKSWIEACRVAAPLSLEGDNLVVGADVTQPLELPAGACLDLLSGRSRCDAPVSFVRCYHIDDAFHNTPAHEVVLCGWPLQKWAEAAGAAIDSFWDASLEAQQRTAWNARLFPAEADPPVFRRWLWMFSPQTAAGDDFRTWLDADRYSLEEMARRTDQQAFHARRMGFRAEQIRGELPRTFRHDSGFSAADLAHLLDGVPQPGVWLAELLGEARRRDELGAATPPEEAFAFSRSCTAWGLPCCMMPTAGADRIRLPPLSIANGRPNRHPMDQVRLTSVRFHRIWPSGSKRTDSARNQNSIVVNVWIGPFGPGPSHSRPCGRRLSPAAAVAPNRPAMRFAATKSPGAEPRLDWIWPAGGRTRPRIRWSMAEPCLTPRSC
jgi:fucokinase